MTLHVLTVANASGNSILLVTQKGPNVTEQVPAGTTSFEQLHYAGDICFVMGKQIKICF